VLVWDCKLKLTIATFFSQKMKWKLIFLKKNHTYAIQQSTVIAGREVLQQAYKELEQKYSDG
jgi:pyridoxine/pyridoxamine 5'-phosphate oxidase